MSRFYIKPVFWNTRGYTRPSGFSAQSGYTKEEGYGLEEWNNAPKMVFEAKDGKRFRAFYTVSLGNAPVEDNDGQIFVFMTASHDSVQQLVGVAAKATCLISDKRRGERENLVERLGINLFWKDAWGLDSVKLINRNDRDKFMQTWKKDLNCVPAWTCPDDYFFWPQTPVTLDPMKITGKKKFLTMYRQYTEIDAASATMLMDSVPHSRRTGAWTQIRHEIDRSFDDPTADIADIKAKQDVSETTRRLLLDARLGQGNFRSALVEIWGGACAVTGCDQLQVLRASHIKPWKLSSDKERLDPNNGLLLVANLDALFDRGLVSFQKTGDMLISDAISQHSCNLLGLPGRLRRPPNANEDAYLRHHRARFFQE